jgi:uncharacterized protein
MQQAGPVAAAQRISSLDMVRGFALLGILLMNIVGFGLHAAYDDPTNAGGATGVNLWTWIVMHVLAEGKMRCLFSMVFGAGVVLLTSGAEARGAGVSTADIYYRRNLWLFTFGIAHAYLLWHGEILYAYGLCALVLFPFRHVSPGRLIAAGAIMFVLIAGANIHAGRELRRTITSGRAAEAAASAGARLSEEQTEAARKWTELRKHIKPTAAEVEQENQRWRGSVPDVLKVRAEHVWRWHTLPYYHYMNLDIFSMMFVGMGLFKLGVFSASRSLAFYSTMAGAGYAIGISVNSYTAYLRVANHFDPVVNAYSSVTYDAGRLSIGLAHVGVLMLFHKAGLFGWILRPLAAIGQTALSNYLMHSVVCSTLFCGYGFALFGRLQRHQLYYVVAGLWLAQMIISPIWLRYFHFGPAEWAWRSLTYWQRQPFRKSVEGLREASAAA